uniref:SRCR domain-containing protein n=1 Tax=Scleropages formosus TaxID=113540 RepID=A0A8C9V2W9_SCLFO
ISALTGDLPSAAARDGDVRLVGGKLSSEGRVEVYRLGHWGTVCDDNWDMAEVVCRQLRYPGARSAVAGGTYRQGAGKIWLDDLNCKGTEKLPSSCSFKGWGISDCSHSEDAGVAYEKSEPTLNSAGLTFLHSSGQGIFALIHPGNTSICVTRLLYCYILCSELMSSISLLGYRYLYTSKIDVTISSAQCLHQLATDYQLKWLQAEVGLFFSWLLPGDPTFEAPAEFYKYAIHTGKKVLQETCFQYLAWNCKALIESPTWSGLSFGTFSALLSRSDVVVPDESYLLQGVWKEETLLSLIRFTMISPEKLYDIQVNSTLYASHKELYCAGLLLGYQFNAVSFLKMRNHTDINTNDCLPRIYTSSPWSLETNFTSRQSIYNLYSRYSNVYYNTAKYFDTPVHNSALFKSKNLRWSTYIFQSHQECLSNGFLCDSVPVTIRYSNRLVLVCDGEYVFHVQDFKNGWGLIPSNSTTGQTYPCHSQNYLYRFVVRPEYI